MKANEFVKKFGLEKAKEFSQITIKGLSQEYCFEISTGESVGLAYVNLDDLKRLVESHELVKAWQLPEDDNDETGVDGARMYLECYAFYSTNEEKAKLDRLDQAIADVESCQ